MGLASELNELQKLRDAGTLTDEEFATAKAALIANIPNSANKLIPDSVSEVIGESLQKKVKHQITMSYIGIAIFAVFFLCFVLFFAKSSNESQKMTIEFDKFGLNKSIPHWGR